VHLAGTGHYRRAIAGGGSYDIPYPTLLAKGIANLFVVGRCMSATRIAHSSARVMGTGISMGHAAGAAAAMAAQSTHWNGDLRSVDIRQLRQLLREQGAILEGTH